MNKYSSGYEAMKLISLVGWIVIGISIISGYIIGSITEGFVGLIIFVCGVVQGVLLLGVGSIGSAILDGSKAQQEVAAHFRNLNKNNENFNINTASPNFTDVEPLPPLNYNKKASVNWREIEYKMGKSSEQGYRNNNDEGLPLHSSYVGYSIFKHPDGFMFDGKVYNTVDEAKRVIFGLIENSEA